MNLLERVKKLCLEMGISQRKLETELGLSNGASSKWSTSSPSIEVLQKVAEYFTVSLDYLLYGFDKTELTSAVNTIRYQRSINDFAMDTGLDEFYLNRLCSGIEYEQPSIDTIIKIAYSNENDWLIDPKYLFNLAGYSLEEVSTTILKDIPPDQLQRYQNKGLSDTEIALTYIDFKNKVHFKQKLNPKPNTIAAHLPEGVELTDEEQEQLDEYIQFILSRRKK